MFSLLSFKVCLVYTFTGCMYTAESLALFFAGRHWEVVLRVRYIPIDHSVIHQRLIIFLGIGVRMSKPGLL
jgi:hypothetical protein